MCIDLEARHGVISQLYFKSTVCFLLLKKSSYGSKNGFRPTIVPANAFADHESIE